MLLNMKQILLLLVQLLYTINAFRIPIAESTLKAETTCGYQSCPVTDPSKLNIHLVAHTHDDVGWLKTVDQYYFGSKTLIQKAGVQYILDSVIQALKDYPDRRFIYVETAYLWKWWQRQSEEVRSLTRRLINEGRLEIIGGAWSMNDEATTHYHSIVDQFTWGFRRLNDTFGQCARPKIGWQIDPFGHSREQASLFAQMGFDGMLFGRLDYEDKSKRLSEKSSEFVWKASSSLGNYADLFTAAMYNTYSPPPGFCFDVLCSDDPVIDDPESPDYNVDQRLGSFLTYSTNQARYFRTNNIILTMGGDFTYQHADMWYKNLDKLIRYANTKYPEKVNVFYSTPSCYLKALNDKKLAWPTKNDDFFPYASDPHAFWTGYFTSRPSLKFFERQGNNFLQICKQLSVIENVKGHEKNLEEFREAMGVMQHHDAVTGTEKQKVAEDYARILYKSIADGEKIVNDAMSSMVLKKKKNEERKDSFDVCWGLNISSCSITENSNEFILTIYNPLSRPITTYARLPVPDLSYTVLDSNQQKVASQLVPIPDVVQKIPGRFSEAVNELVFRAEAIPAFGFKVYFVKAEATRQEIFSTDSRYITGNNANITVDNGQILVRFDRENKKLNFAQSFRFYEGAEGNNEVWANRSSGAYIFRPKNPYSSSFNFTGTYKIYKGDIVQEIHLQVNDWVSEVVRVYSAEDFIEFDWMVGPIPVDDKVGKEIVTKYSSNLSTGGYFYTDSNGREMLQRKRDYRPTWQVRLQEQISGNYYPVTAKISIKDTELPLKLNVLTDRAQGGSSLVDGEVELMLHRRLLKDDAFGVAEALNETAFGKGMIAKGKHIVFAGEMKNIDDFVLREKELALQLLLQPLIMITNKAEKTGDEWRKNFKTQDSAVTSLPPNIHVLTLEPWKDDTVLLRLEHVFEINEAKDYSKAVTVNLKNLFSKFTIESVQETTLGGNQWLKDMNRLRWNSESNNITEQIDAMKPVEVRDNVINVTINPMEIRTFIVKLRYNSTNKV
ncbi:lysosomal alpha-mannosidase isoform X1 [Prorops nasuta]|uniref:lysosomal alpha-mannosidase isoform X1 n=1 Tax=Prorops nasuta TaxID=863751 RepID=UPI0034CEA5A0